MRLDSVEIVGFKSFCDKQEVSFRGGVTGIVGPNGCGKSNISDAISWVLGEQSAKSLRGASMEDVIFNGSEARQPVQMAEVNLKVSGLNGNSPDGSPDCVVTRRLYRSGESEYLMNGRICRLRDVHELFMDTGLGSKAYSIIEQGKIGLILSSKPPDRRALIEEAAGITKYKARRRQTQLKLDAAQQNLLRVNDIVHEVEKQLESLKRQASKARRYRLVRDEMQGVERVVYGRRYVDLEEQGRSLAERLGVESEREQAASVALDTEEAQMEVRRHALYEEEGRLEEVRGRLNELTLALDRHQGRSGYCKEQMGEADARAEEARREAGELEARVLPLHDSLLARRADEARLRVEVEDGETDTGRAEAAVQECAFWQNEAEREQERARDTQVGLMGKIAALQNTRASVSGNAERATADLLKLAGEGEELVRERRRVEGLRAGAEAKLAEIETRVAGLGGDRDAAASRAAESEGRAQGLAREAEMLQSERDSLLGRLSSLHEIVETHAAFDEGVRAILALQKATADEAFPEVAADEPGYASAAGRESTIAVLGVVADALETDSAHERAVEAFLGDRLQAVLTPEAIHAVRGIRYLQESAAGRVTFLPLASAQARNDGEALARIARQDPKAKGLLSDLYRVTGPHADLIRAALPNALVVDSLDDAFDIIARHGHVDCATLAGETVRGDLVEGGRGVKGLLAPRREVRELAARRASLEIHLADVRTRGAAEEAAAVAASAEMRALEQEIHAAEKDRVAVRHDVATAQDEAVRLDRKHGVIETERSQAEEEQGAAAGRLLEIEQLLGQAEAERTQGTERLAGLAAAVTEARASSEAVLARASETKSRLAALRERAAAAHADCNRLAQDHEELLGRIAAALGRGRDMAARREQLAAELVECERLLDVTLGQRDRVLGETAVAEDRVRDIRNELEGRELGLKERRREREMLRDALSELEIARARTDSDLDHLARECLQAVGQTTADTAAGLTEEDRTAIVQDLEARIVEMRERLDRMGAVNVLAVEQAQELEDRHQFLTAQRQDLLDSIAELDQAIKKIDRTSRERFRAAFQVINQHFGEIFRQLFGGGTAGLSLIDEEDILESGIDVMAQPPGKRLQNVMLLSGGEKAMTAISLLFAIFQYKPSPFCILDEVDAPLDDANIGRFVKMLEGMKEQTQFVLITHSRKTMEIADQLYGVTMEEPGVSKLVSVRFN